MRALVVTTAALAFLVALGVTEAPAAHAHGLLVSRPANAPTPAETPAGPVVLARHRVEAKVDGPVAHVTVEQVFANRSAAQLEGTYLFPLPEGAAVSRFAMTMGGRMVEGEIVEASRAREIYESIVRRRRDPGLLEYVGRGLFRARVFPIEPRSELTIRLAFQQVLPEDAGTLELRYPLATDRLHGDPVGETVVVVDVESDAPIQAIYSPSHPLAVVRRGETGAHVSYESANRRQDRDLLLYVGRSPEDVGCSVLSHQAPGEDGTFLAVLAPSVDRSDAPRVAKDLVFVIDTSGSMREHAKIAQARRAVTFGVRTLHADDRFNVVSFASEVRPFREGLVEATDETIAAAERWVADLSAVGGTNIEGALTTALEMGRSERLPLVVFVTDGQPTVGERDAGRLVELVERQNAAKARVFTFGVGFDLDVHLLDRIAEATQGARDYVMPKEELEIATSRFFRKVVEPVLVDVEIEFGGPVHDVYPRRLPDLFAGSQVVVLGRYAEGGARTLRLRGRLGEQEVEYVHQVRLETGERAPYLPRLWAQRKVAFLLDEIRLHGEARELVDEVVRLATRHAIVTPYTSGLVVEEEELPPPPPRRRFGGSGQFRGPGETVPPGVRQPTDPTPPPAPGTPPPTPSGPGKHYRGPSGVVPPSIRDSARLQREKERADERGSERVRTVSGKTFVRKPDGRWVDTAWDESAEPPPEIRKVEFLSPPWTELARKGPKVAKILALGERVLFVWEGQVYEVVPAPGAEEGE